MAPGEQPYRQIGHPASCHALRGDLEVVLFVAAEEARIAVAHTGGATQIEGSVQS